MTADRARRIFHTGVLTMLAIVAAITVSAFSIVVYWGLEPSPMTLGQSAVIDPDTMEPAEAGRLIHVRRGSAVLVQRHYSVATAKSCRVFNTIEDGVIIAMPDEPAVGQIGEFTRIFSRTIPMQVSAGRINTLRTRIVCYVNPLRPAETFWHQPVQFFVEE